MWVTVDSQISKCTARILLHLRSLWVCAHRTHDQLVRLCLHQQHLVAAYTPLQMHAQQANTPSRTTARSHMKLVLVLEKSYLLRDELRKVLETPAYVDEDGSGTLAG